MIKKLAIVFLILLFLFSAAVVYLNMVFLPTKVKSMIIQSLQEYTGKKVSLQNLQLNIFKGLVLRDLSIADEKNVFLNLKEGSCSFLFWPLFNKQLVISSVKLERPVIYLERRADNTLNIYDFFIKKQKNMPAIAQVSSAGAASAKQEKFNISVSRLIISDAVINFKDSYFKETLEKKIEGLNLAAYFSFPESIKFKISAHILCKEKPLKISSQGEYLIKGQKCQAHIILENFQPQEFAAYYQGSGINFTSGYINGQAQVNFAKNKLNCDLAFLTKGLLFFKDKIQACLDSTIKSNLDYDFVSKAFNYSGNIDLGNLELLGINPVGKIQAIKGLVLFNKTGIYAENLTAQVFDLPVQAKFKLADFSKPLLSINAYTSADLSLVKPICDKSFKLQLPFEPSGKAKLSFMLQSELANNSAAQISGSLDLIEANLKFKESNNILESINGRLIFSANQLNCDGLKFKYQGIGYLAKASLTNFQAPGIQLELSSQELNLVCNFSLNNKKINISQAKGKYLNSDFLISGNVDFSEPQNFDSELSAKVNFNLTDLNQLFIKQKSSLEKIKPQGNVLIEGNLKGNLLKIEDCSLQSKLTSGKFSLYGLNADTLNATFNQEAGVVDIPDLRIGLYGGSIEASATSNLKAKKMPFKTEINIKEVKLGELIKDTSAKKEQIAGTLDVEGKFKGYLGDFREKLIGQGKVNITDGKFWGLNLFQGIGSLVFSQDFSNIVFSKGSASFSVNQETVTSPDVHMEGDVTVMDGQAKIGFDGSIDAWLDVKVSKDIPFSGTLKDVTTAIMGTAGRFGRITITGTLDKPKHSFSPAVVDILKGIKDSFFSKN